MNRCTLEVGDDLVGGLCLSSAKIRMRRHACLVEFCVGRGIPQHAPLCRTGCYIRFANDFLCLHFIPWQICKDPNTETFHQKQAALRVSNLILSQFPC